MCLACSHVVRCSETALVFNLACSLNRVRKLRTVLRCNLRISFLTKYSPCLPRNGILTHILEMFSSAMLLELFSEDVLLYGAGSLLLCFDFNFLSIAHRKLAGKPFHATHEFGNGRNLSV